MTRNEGSFDRGLRAAIGMLLVILALAGVFAAAWLYWGAIIVGVVLLVTAATGFCPAYRLLGVRTCRG